MQIRNFTLPRHPIVSSGKKRRKRGRERWKFEGKKNNTQLGILHYNWLNLYMSASARTYNFLTGVFISVVQYMESSRLSSIPLCNPHLMLLELFVLLSFSNTHRKALAERLYVCVYVFFIGVCVGGDVCRWCFVGWEGWRVRLARLVGLLASMDWYHTSRDFECGKYCTVVEQSSLTGDVQHIFFF